MISKACKRLAVAEALRQEWDDQRFEVRASTGGTTIPTASGCRSRGER